MKRNADMTVNSQETWLVTGAASGIGAAVVRAVRRAGHQVLALDINDAAGQPQRLKRALSIDTVMWLTLLIGKRWVNS